jgi:hypothetical protein
MELVGVGTPPLVVPPIPGMRADDLDGKRLPAGIDTVGIKAVLPVPVGVIPSRESTPDTRPPRTSPEVGVAEAETEVVAEAGTLTGTVGSMLESDAVAMVLFPEDELSPSNIPRRSVPELVVELSLGLMALGVAEARVLVEPPRPRSSPREDRPEPTTPRRPSEAETGVLEALAADESVRLAGVEVTEAEAELLVEPPRPRSSPREDRPEPTTPRRPALDEDPAAVETVVEGVVEAWADESAAEAGVADAELLLDSPRPRSSPREDRPEPTTPRRPPLEEDAAAVEAVVEALATEEPVAGCCWLVVSASVEGTSEFFWTLLSVLDPSVFLVVVVVVAVGSPPMVVVPVIRWVISGFLGSTEMVTTTTSSPFWL